MPWPRSRTTCVATVSLLVVLGTLDSAAVDLLLDASARPLNGFEGVRKLAAFAVDVLRDPQGFQTGVVDAGSGRNCSNYTAPFEVINCFTEEPGAGGVKVGQI